ncbi:DUF2846 domain-containing protein [Pseudomonas nicosulfuronedens]|uniref:DUF2846 domain-containing protein n=1 Tax=Pseudomonas nicosulfuronedens TaxID=2571105 RepID=A0A5R9QQG0_9PSED|nr:DUF2846 domain-containing protein [Pseudomonas nicosulfuronedens]MDH1008464.1 DUF2846 domain-containing protein [Pseudomonas nicosulfuronedens]MDH1982005.1 DUF2846 domain-containing protein [Pseudomonas nicosulfuronedens]MDH2030405.1 DUF2846 domain-containing protein [Pseudomonas nicosulfuronedens]TLX72028.1 DUF2846 domain-containing protein [Pseudomonas nicosulfuronedens]
MHFHRVLLLIGTMLLASCTTLHSGESFKEPAATRSDAALVYVYRKGIPPLWRDPTLLIDDREVSEIKNKSFTYFYLAEGTHKIATKWAIDLFPLNMNGTLDVKNGEVYYLRLGGGMMFFPGVHGLSTSVSSNLSQVSADAGMSEIKECMYIENQVPAIR